MIMSSLVLELEAIDRTQVSIVGGKAAHLGELTRVEGIRVPQGFVVTTTAFRQFMLAVPSIAVRLDRLSRLTPEDRNTIGTLSADIRDRIENSAIPDDLAAAITRAITRLGEPNAFAVRSSATAEDLPTASFAGQHDTFLNVTGTPSILQYVRRCWASLFTDRAVTYRLRNGVDHAKVHMAVLVQRVVFPYASGILFTADPLTGNRKVASVEASFGFGEALVSGLVIPDVYTVRDGTVVTRKIGAKERAMVASSSGGTHALEIGPERQLQPALSDAQVVRLVQMGRCIEAHFGTPQDIEWCVANDEFHVVQSRPITTLFPLPVVSDSENHVYLSVGHQQMMTDAMKPLGLSVWQMTTRATMAEAGGRLFVDVTKGLASPASRDSLLKMVGRSDPLIGDALQTILDRGDLIPLLPGAPAGWVTPGAGHPPIETDLAIPAELIARSEASLTVLKHDIQSKSGSALLEFIRADIQELKRIQFDPQSLRVIMAGMEAAWWLNEHLETWFGEKNAADSLAQSVPDNVTSEMGLALLDVADVVRTHPDVVTFLQRVNDNSFLDELGQFAGGREVRDAIVGWLDRFGARGVGEIDLTRPRWSEHPSMLLPLLLGNVRNFEPGAARRRFEQGRLESSRKEQELLDRVRALPEGEQKASDVKRMIDRLRTFAGYREYPKYGMVRRYFVYKQALMREAKRLVRDGVLQDREDIFYLRFEEIEDVVRTQRVDEQLIRERKEAFAWYEKLTPPRVLTSDGEMLNGSYRRDAIPAGALPGLPVSSGVVEGRARVILDIADADVEPGDILVTAYTDPSWTPLFVAIKGLVTEVGGLMTHGAVIAREYGLPAVVGVQHATRLIRDGQRIRVHGTDGYVEILT